MNKFDTEIGKIYCIYNEETDNFTKIRVINFKDGMYTIANLDNNNHINTKEQIRIIDENEFNKIKKSRIVLKSEGIVSITNVVSVSNKIKEIKDVLVIYFPNNKITRVPDCNQPYIVARQGINNIFATMANQDTVGMSVSIDTLPAGYALSDFMGNEKVISSRMTHVYLTDTENDLSILLNNDTTNNILNDLYDHAIHFLRNTIDGYKHNIVKDDCVNGYCNSIKRFLVESDFIGDYYSNLGIIKVDFELKDNVPITGEDKLMISTLYGGIHIVKAVPLSFDYDINRSVIKMRYMLINDINNNLFIVPYTISENEIDVDAVYKITEEATLSLQERLKKVIKAYDKSKGITSGTISEVCNN